MARSYSCPGLRRVSPATRQGRPMCRCVIADGAKLLAWVGCKRCLGTGGDGAPANAPVGPEATSSLSGGT